MDFLKRLIGGGPPRGDGAIHLYVRCNHCGAPVHVRVDPRNDLSIEYGDSEEPSGYRLIKEMMDSRCFRIMRAEIDYDGAKREISRQIEGGTFISKDEHDRLIAGGEVDRRVS